jgi:hypothetical protein
MIRAPAFPFWATTPRPTFDIGCGEFIVIQAPRWRSGGVVVLDVAGYNTITQQIHGSAKSSVSESWLSNIG